MFIGKTTVTIKDDNKDIQKEFNNHDIMLKEITNDTNKIKNNLIHIKNMLLAIQKNNEYQIFIDNINDTTEINVVDNKIEFTTPNGKAYLRVENNEIKTERRKNTTTE